jgi:hypothetical protein
MKEKKFENEKKKSQLVQCYYKETAYLLVVAYS